MGAKKIYCVGIAPNFKVFLELKEREEQSMDPHKWLRRSFPNSN